MTVLFRSIMSAISCNLKNILSMNNEWKLGDTLHSFSLSKILKCGVYFYLEQHVSVLTGRLSCAQQPHVQWFHIGQHSYIMGFVKRQCFSQIHIQFRTPLKTQQKRPCWMSNILCLSISQTAYFASCLVLCQITQLANVQGPYMCI